MKPLLITTDFSENSKPAVHYGYELARYIKANVILCNAIIIPAEIPNAGFVVWPTDEYNTLMKNSSHELKELKKELERTLTNSSFKPQITCANESGAVCSVIAHETEKHQAEIIIIGEHGNAGIGQFLIGNHARNLIDSATKPLLIVPPTARFAVIKRIALALDFNTPDQDMNAVTDLIPFAKMLDAEILLTHIYNDHHFCTSTQQYLNTIMERLAQNNSYSKIDTLLVKDTTIEDGLNWFCKYGHIDVLAMVHRPKRFFASLFNESHTKNMAAHLCVPLFVFPFKSKI